MLILFNQPDVHELNMSLVLSNLSHQVIKLSKRNHFAFHTLSISVDVCLPDTYLFITQTLNLN